MRLGDRLIGVAPGTWVDPDTLQGERGWQRLYQDWGFDLVIPEQSLGQWTYFSASDNDRAALLRQAWRVVAARLPPDRRIALTRYPVMRVVSVATFAADGTRTDSIRTVLRRLGGHVPSPHTLARDPCCVPSCCAP